MNKKNQAKQRHNKKLKRAKKLQARGEMYGTNRAAEVKAIQKFRSKKRPKRNIQKEIDAKKMRGAQQREMMAKTTMPMMGEIKEVKPGFFAKLKDKILKN